MIKFELPAGTRAKLTKVTPRKEQHGPELKQAVSLRLRHEGTGDLLDLLAPGLRDASLMVPPADDTQELIPGVPLVPTLLRVQGVDQVRKLPELKLTGYTLTIEHGIDDESALQFYVCSIDKVTAEPKQGGGCVIEWSVGSNREVTKELIGELCDLEGTEVVLRQEPPMPGTIDASSGQGPTDGGGGLFDDPEDDDGNEGSEPDARTPVDALAESVGSA